MSQTSKRDGRDQQHGRDVVEERRRATAVMSTSMTMITNGRPRARLAAQMARYSNRPVCRRMPTMIIMPSNRKMTFQSIPLSSEKKTP